MIKPTLKEPAIPLLTPSFIDPGHPDGLIVDPAALQLLKTITVPDHSRVPGMLSFLHCHPPPFFHRSLFLHQTLYLIHPLYHSGSASKH